MAKVDKYKKAFNRCFKKPPTREVAFTLIEKDNRLGGRVEPLVWVIVTDKSLTCYYDGAIKYSVSGEFKNMVNEFFDNQWLKQIIGKFG